MNESSYLASITVRVPLSMIMKLDSKAGREKNGTKKEFRDRSDALRAMVDLGFQISDLMNVLNDPEKRKEFEEKFSHVLKGKNVERQLESMGDDELNTIIFYAQNLKEKKIQLLIDNLKQS